MKRFLGVLIALLAAVLYGKRADAAKPLVLRGCRLVS